MEFKNLLFLTAFVFLFIPIVDASIMDIQNDSPQPHETIIGIISSSGGIQTTLNKSNLLFYKNEAQVTPQEYNIYFYNDKYYFYFIFSEEGNYSFVIDFPVTYKTGTGTLSSETINELIEVKYNEDKSVLQIKPGIVYGQGSFKIDLNNKGEKDLEIKSSIENLTISSGDSRRLEFEKEAGISFLEISSYKMFSIPVISLSTVNKPNYEETKTDKEIILNEDNKLEFIIKMNKKEDYSITLKNIGELNITNISVGSDISGITIKSYSEELSPNEEGEILLSAKFDSEGEVSGYFFLNYSIGDEQRKLQFPKSFYVNKNSDFDASNSSDVVICEEIGAEICKDGEFISGGRIVFCNNTYGHIGGECVTSEGNPTEDPKTGTGWVAILIIVIILGLLGFGIYKKYKKVK